MKFFSLVICVVFSFSHLKADILHYSETNGYNHGTQSASLALFQEIADSLGQILVDDQDGSEFDTWQNLQRFDIVVFSNTTGNGGLSQLQRDNFEIYIQNGGSYIGIHAASDSYRHSSANGNNTGKWDWYAETVTGCSMQNGPNHTAANFSGTILLSDPNTALSTGLPSTWIKTDEYYYWENGYLSPDFTELLKVDSTGTSSYDTTRMVAQYRNLPGGGKTFYTSLGHSRSSFTSDPEFEQLLWNVVSWMQIAVFSIQFEEPEVIARINPRIVNPTKDKIVFMGNLDDSRHLKMSVYDMQGKQLAKFESETSPNELLVWENSIILPNGLYMVNVSSYGKIITSNLILFQN